MPARDIARFYPVNVHGHDCVPGLIRKYAEDRVQRAHPAERARAPAHGFRPGEVADCVLDGLGDDFGCGTARTPDRGEPDLPLLVVTRLQLILGQSGRPEEAFQRLLGRIRSGALAFLNRAGCLGEQIRGDQHQPPRRRKRFGVRIGQPGLDHVIGHEFLQVLRRARLHAGGDLLGEELKQEVGHGSGLSGCSGGV